MCEWQLLKVRSVVEGLTSGHPPQPCLAQRLGPVSQSLGVHEVRAIGSVCDVDRAPPVIQRTP